MKIYIKISAILLLWSCTCLFAACGSSTEVGQNTENSANQSPEKQQASTDTDIIPLRVERNETSDAPIGKYDFRNYVYPLPIGWQGAGIKEITLENGKFPMSKESIGATYVGTKFGDVNGDGQEEAMVVIKIETGGSANPQVVYVFEWKDNEPKMISYFRTGDRADGGIKDLRAENGELVLQLYGQDRYLTGNLETMKITGDVEQICCPTYFTRTRYKWDGNVFKMQGKRETYSITDKNALPVENMSEIVERENSKK